VCAFGGDALASRAVADRYLVLNVALMIDTNRIESRVHAGERDLFPPKARNDHEVIEFLARGSAANEAATARTQAVSRWLAMHHQDIKTRWLGSTTLHFGL
jgi:hypothetical protein